MKPHEEEWYFEKAYGDVFLQVGTSPSDDMDLSLDNGPAPSLGGDHGHDARQTLRAAAPDMARALLAAWEHDKQYRENPEGANRSPIGLVVAALKKAGVLP